jgi:hypothetical protein
MSRGAAEVLAGVALVAAAACSGRSNASVGSRLGPAITAALAVADETREPWRCASTEGPGAAIETLTAGNRQWQIDGHAMTLDATGELVIGVIADAAGSAPATLAALGRLRAQLEHVDLVIALGGMGTTRAELDAVFAALADRATWPVVALPGDLESVDALVDTIAAARQRGTLLVDGRLIQRIELPAATIALVPGASAASRLMAGTAGCLYREADVAAAFADLTPRPGLRILGSSEAPRHGSSDHPVGELALTAGAGQQIDLALHGPAGDAASPAATGRRAGAAVALTPGSSDAMPRLPGPYRRPSAGLLTIRSGAWSWTPLEDVK